MQAKVLNTDADIECPDQPVHPRILIWNFAALFQNIIDVQRGIR